MGKKINKTAGSAAAAAAEQKAPGVQENGDNTQNPTKKVEVIQTGDLLNAARSGGKKAGLSPDATVMALNGLKTMVHDNPNAAEYYGIGEEGVKKLNHFTLAGFATVLAIECAENKSPFAVAMLAKQPEAINAIQEYTGVSIDIKALPAPDENGEVKVPSSAIKVTKEAKEGIKQEQEIATKKVELDPTKIENDDQLKDALLHILVKGSGNVNFYAKVATAINFYESYLSVQANKSENKEEALKAIKDKTRAELFSEIAKLLGKCTFTINGMAKFMYEHTERTKNPVVAFCMFRDASLNENNGMPQIEDSLVADIVKVLIRWYADSEIQTTNEKIASYEKDLEKLKKDEKKNAKGIEEGKKVIENAKKHIEDIESVVTYANIPSRAIVDSFAKDYVDDSAEGYKFARMMGSKILNSYYPGVKASEIETENLVHNLQQYMGVIFNLFLPAMQRLSDFSEANITELKKKEAEQPAEKN